MAALHPAIIPILVILLVISAGVPFIMAFLPCAGFYLPIICQGTTEEKVVSVTFDDGPDPIGTPLLLNVLRKFDVKATFFCIGRNLERHRSLAEMIHREGHLLGNHSFRHAWWFDLQPAARMRTELDLTDRLIREVTGRTPAFFRPPFGVVNPMVRRALKNRHWSAICWNIRTFDTVRNDPQKIIRKITGRLKPGSVILLHDHTRVSRLHLDELLSSIRDAGYRIVPLDEMLNLPAYVS